MSGQSCFVSRKSLRYRVGKLFKCLIETGLGIVVFSERIKRKTLKHIKETLDKHQTSKIVFQWDCSSCALTVFGSVFVTLQNRLWWCFYVIDLNHFTFFISLYQLITLLFYSWSSSEKSTSCSFSCVSASTADLHTLENIQKKLVSWITGKVTMSYLSHLRFLNILLLPMFLQLNHIPLWLRITHKEIGSSDGLPAKLEIGGKKVKFSNFGREEQIRREVSSSEIVDSSEDWTISLTPWTNKDWWTDF